MRDHETLFAHIRATMPRLLLLSGMIIPLGPGLGPGNGLVVNSGYPTKLLENDFVSLLRWAREDVANILNGLVDGFPLETVDYVNVRIAIRLPVGATRRVYMFEIRSSNLKEMKAPIEAVTLPQVARVESSEIDEIQALIMGN